MKKQADLLQTPLSTDPTFNQMVTVIAALVGGLGLNNQSSGNYNQRPWYPQNNYYGSGGQRNGNYYQGNGGESGGNLSGYNTQYRS